jgi:hypothetical protein
VACGSERIFVGGDFQGSLVRGDLSLSLESKGALDMFAVALDLDQNVKLARRFGDDKTDNVSKQHLAAIATDANGDLLLAGDLAGTVSFGVGACVRAAAEILAAGASPTNSIGTSARIRTSILTLRKSMCSSLPRRGSRWISRTKTVWGCSSTSSSMRVERLTRANSRLAVRRSSSIGNDPYSGP